MDLQSFKSIASNKWVSTSFKVIMSCLAFYLLYNKVDLDLVKFHISNANLLFLLLAIITFTFSKIASAIRLNEYYRTQALVIEQLTNIKIYFNAMFYNLIIPLVGGEAFKVLWINNNYKTNTKSLIWSALLDRGGGLVALAVLSILCVYFVDINLPFKKLVFILIPITYLGSYLIHKWFFQSYSNAQKSVNGLSFVVQVLQVVTVYLIMLALGIQENVMAYVFVFLLSSFAYILPFIGARELAFVYGAEFLGLNEEVSLTISLLFYLVIVVNSLMGGLFFIFPIKK